MKIKLTRSANGSLREITYYVQKHKGIGLTQTELGKTEEFYLNSFAQSIKESEEYKNSEYLLFSFHGLPVRQLKKSDPSGMHCQKVENCCEQISEFNEFC